MLLFKKNDPAGRTIGSFLHESSTSKKFFSETDGSKVRFSWTFPRWFSLFKAQCLTKEYSMHHAQTDCRTQCTRLCLRCFPISSYAMLPKSTLSARREQNVSTCNLPEGGYMYNDFLLFTCTLLHVRTKTCQHPWAFAPSPDPCWTNLSIRDVCKIKFRIELTSDQKRIRSRSWSNRQKSEDTGEFLRQIRHVPDESAKWSDVHSILHHQKPLLHCLDGCRGWLWSGKIKKSSDTEGKMNPLTPW